MHRIKWQTDGILTNIICFCVSKAFFCFAQYIGVLSINAVKTQNIVLSYWTNTNTPGKVFKRRWKIAQYAKKVAKKCWQEAFVVIKYRHCLARAVQRQSQYESKKVFRKKSKKVSKTYWQREEYVIYSLSCPRERVSEWTLKIKQRDKKRNPRFDGKIPSRRVFKSTFQTVIRKLK